MGEGMKMKIEQWIIGGCASLAFCACGDSGTATESGTVSNSGTNITTMSTDATASTTDGKDTDTSEGSGSGTETSAPTPTTTEATPTTTVGVTDGTTTEPLPPGVCGDGQVNPGEECDHGEANGPDALCSDTCTLLTPCGNGVVDPGEDCDLGPQNGPDNGCSLECTILSTSCGTQEAEAQLVAKPVDIIITIDNSGSMGEEIVGVQNNINVNFAQIIEASGLDYRVIMVARYGNDTSESVCIEAPLSGIPEGGCEPPPSMPVNGERFFHYSIEIGSHDSWCKLLRTYNGTDKAEFGFAPDGWREWLRPDAFKVFLELTDDGVQCSYGGKNYDDNDNVNDGQSSATIFDEALRALDAVAFGDSPENRNYKWYSIVGMAYNNPPEQPYGPMDPVISGKCSSAEANGTGYQALSNLTGGLRFPLCDTTKYDVVFQSIANGVVNDAKIACDFEIPPPPDDKTLDEDSIVVLFTPSGQADPIILTQVPGPDQCDPMSFYVDSGKVILCPAACTLAQNDKDAQLKVEFTCDPLMPL